MRLTLAAPLTPHGRAVDVEVVAGTPWGDVLAAVGAPPCDAWCGTQEVRRDHPAGVPPLTHGARVDATPGDPTSPLVGPHAEVIAGPDAGVVVPLDVARVWGRDPAAADVVLADPSLSRRHARLAPAPHGATLTDLGSTNASMSVARAGLRTLWSRRVELAPGAVVRLGDSWVLLRGGGGGAGEGGASDVADRAAAPGPASGTASPAALTGMIGAGVSALVLAAMTGRWYLALLALIMPLVMLAPRLSARLVPPPPDLTAGLPLPHREAPAWLWGPIVVTGQEDCAAGTVRALVLARGRRPPAHPLGLEEDWWDWLPPALPGDGPLLRAAQAPSWCETHLDARPEGTVIMRQGFAATRAAPWRVSAARAEAAARRRAGGSGQVELPRTLRWGDVEGNAPAEPSRWCAPVGLRRVGERDEPWLLDLDADGPHFLVAGTTGAGKSAFLETLVLAFAHRFGPERLEIALLDFKGGASLAACASLPHVVGTVTDLDGRQARRALAALEAALRERKHLLAQAGFAHLAQWEEHGGAPARLLVVVDEFQEVGALHPEFMPGLNRLAAQGRSLGMHVVLATQRPSGAVTPQIRANTSTTIALRVASETESRDLIGTSQAAFLPADAPGRSVVATTTTRVEAQVALPIATPSPRVRLATADPEGDRPTSLAQATQARHEGSPAARPLWHAPLPARVTVDEVRGGEAGDGGGSGARIAVGLEDWPLLRERGPLVWDVATGPLVVVSGHGPVRQAALAAAIGGARDQGLCPVVVPADPREAARTVALACAREDVLLVVPDAGAAVTALGRVDRGARLEDLLAYAAQGKPLAVALGAATPQRLAQHAGLRLVAAGLSATDEALWGVPRDLADVEGEYTVRAWSSRGWREAVVAADGSAAAHALVTPLPLEWSGPEGGPDAWTRAGHGGTVQVGVGGDEATPVSVSAGEEIAVVGPPGPELTAVTQTLTAAGARIVATAELPALLPPQARGGTLVVVEPHPRVVDELCRVDGAGLVDPVPRAGRVVWVTGGRGRCVQLATGTRGGSEPQRWVPGSPVPLSASASPASAPVPVASP